MEEEAVMFCNPLLAMELLEEDEDIKADALVISTLTPVGEVVLVPLDEFMEWLYKKGGRKDAVLQTEQP